MNFCAIVIHSFFCLSLLSLLSLSAGDDVPDLCFIDSDGDGDYGNDGTANGSPSLPYRTFQAGYNAAKTQNKDVYITSGVYNVPDQITLQAGVGIYGGYRDYVQGTYSRTSDKSVLIFASSTGFYASNLQPSPKRTVLELLDIRTANAGPLTPPTNPNAWPESAYAIMAINSPGLVVRKCALRPGNGEDAPSATGVPSKAQSGNNGSPGNKGCTSASGACRECSAPPVGYGGYGGNCGANNHGGNGGGAGLGTEESVSPGGTGSTGSCATFFDGITYNCNPGQSGSGGAGGTSGGCETSAGCPSDDCCDNFFQSEPCCWTSDTQGPNQCAGTWQRGGSGFNGMNPTAQHTGTVGSWQWTSSGYKPLQGSTGRRGQPGGGGGGGGGGYGGADGCNSYGGSAAGGGGGGCGGYGGYGAYGGGASIAFYVWSSDLTLVASSLVAGNGGDAGLGNVGGLGGDGGAGGYYSADQSNTYHITCKGNQYGYSDGGGAQQEDAGNGGIGGAGGAGGRGGRGGDGAAGPSIALARYNSNGMTIVDTTFAVGVAGDVNTGVSTACPYTTSAPFCGGAGSHPVYDLQIDDPVTSAVSDNLIVEIGITAPASALPNVEFGIDYTLTSRVNQVTDRDYIVHHLIFPQTTLINVTSSYGTCYIQPNGQNFLWECPLGEMPKDQGIVVSHFLKASEIYPYQYYDHDVCVCVEDQSVLLYCIDSGKSANVEILRYADMTVSIDQFGATTQVAGESLGTRLLATNLGLGEAPGVFLDFTVPVGTLPQDPAQFAEDRCGFVNSTHIHCEDPLDEQPQVWYYFGPPGGFPDPAKYLVMDFITPPDVTEFEIDLSIGAAPIDSNMGNNDATLLVTLTFKADVSSNFPDDTVPVGVPVSLSCSITNVGPSVAVDVIVEIEIPQMVINGVSGDAISADCTTFGNDKARCDIPMLYPDTHDLVLSAIMPVLEDADLQTEAYLSFTTPTFDPNDSNNNSSATLTITIDLPAVVQLIPAIGPKEGGTVVRVEGDLVNSLFLAASFGGNPITPTFIEFGAVSVVSPVYNSAWPLQSAIEVSTDGINFSIDNVNFTYYDHPSALFINESILMENSLPQFRQFLIYGAGFFDSEDIQARLVHDTFDRLANCTYINQTDVILCELEEGMHFPQADWDTTVSMNGVDFGPSTAVLAMRDVTFAPTSSPSLPPAESPSSAAPTPSPTANVTQMDIMGGSTPDSGLSDEILAAIIAGSVLYCCLMVVVILLLVRWYRKRQNYETAGAMGVPLDFVYSPAHEGPEKEGAKDAKELKDEDIYMSKHQER